MEKTHEMPMDDLSDCEEILQKAQENKKFKKKLKRRKQKQKKEKDNEMEYLDSIVREHKEK